MRRGPRGSRRARGGARTSPSGRSGARAALRRAGAPARARPRASRSSRRPGREAERLREPPRRVHRQDERPPPAPRGGETDGAESVVFPTPPGPVRTISFSSVQPRARSRCGWFGGKKRERLACPERGAARRASGGGSAKAPMKILFEGGEKRREKRRGRRADLAALLSGDRARRDHSMRSPLLLPLRSPGSRRAQHPVSLFSRISSLPPRPTRFTTTPPSRGPRRARARHELLRLRRRQLGGLGDGDERGARRIRRGARRRRARACAAVRSGTVLRIVRGRARRESAWPAAGASRTMRS